MWALSRPPPPTHSCPPVWKLRGTPILFTLYFQGVAKVPDKYLVGK